MKTHTLVSGGDDRSRHSALVLAHADGGEQRTDTDAGSAQVIDLVDLQAGVDLAGIGQDVADLVGGDGIQAAAEGVQLDQIQIVSGSLQSWRLRTAGSGTSTDP